MLKYGQLDSPHFRWWVQVGYQFKMTPDFKENHEKSTNSPYTPYYYMLQKSAKKNSMAPFHGWGSTASREEPLGEGSLLF